MKKEKHLKMYNILHNGEIIFVLFITEYHHHQTDLQNLWREKKHKKMNSTNILHPCIHGCAYILWYSKINQNMSFLNNILHIKHAVLSKMRVWALIGVSGLFSMNLSKGPLIKTPLNDTCSATSSTADTEPLKREDLLRWSQWSPIKVLYMGSFTL